MNRKNRTRKLLLTAIVVGGTAAVAGGGVFAAYTATSVNGGNSITAGTVAIGNSGIGSALYDLPNQGPGSVTQRCVRVTYTGTLGATVRLYRAPGTLSNGTAFNLTVERGTGLTNAFSSCTGFTGAVSLYNGTLGGFPTTYAAGPDAKGSAWAVNNTVDYRFTVTVVDDPTPDAHTSVISSGAHDFRWEARSN